MSFAPIAIVGRACLLPGVATPESLWEGFLAGTDYVAGVAPGRWRLDPELALGQPGGALDRAFSDRGGRVTGFDALFDPSGFALPADEVAAHDPLVRWCLHAGREALRDAGLTSADHGRTGAVLGNLSLPSEGLAAWTEATWLEAQSLPDALRSRISRPAPAARFMSGLPAHLLARALGLGGGAFALDAACASALYAIKLACDRLQDGEVDVMLAGAVNRADNLFLHVGFSTLKALSPSGRSRPFQQGADGLLPAEGVAFVVLKRLEDAQAAGDRILGVIRGVGLSNDGRSTGMLAPAEEGQARAMRLALGQAGWQPTDVGLVECHATGTALGDATEVRSLAAVYGEATALPLGSAKSNFGHTITVAGLVGLLKVLGAMEAGVRPPTLHVDQPVDALANTAFRPLRAAEPWEAEGPRRAAVSAFGFGGNNAHLLVEQYSSISSETPCKPERATVAIVGLAVHTADLEDTAAFARALFSGEPHLAPAKTIQLRAEHLRVPPIDLAETLPQQLWVLDAATEALSTLQPLPRERTAVMVGMQTDAEVARHGLRWRLAQWEAEGRAAGAHPPDGWLKSAQDAACPPLQAARVIGTLPNAVTNRLNAHFDLAGPSFSVSAEEHSGLVALDLAARALRQGEVDAAVVGAVDFACEASHQAALQALRPDAPPPGDATVVLVLKRLEDAQAAGDPVYAVLGDATTPTQWTVADLSDQFGHAHAAAGLLQLAAAALALRHQALPRGLGQEATPWLSDREPRAARVTCAALGAATRSWVLIEAPATPALPALPEAAPRLYVYAGADRAAVAAAAREGREATDGPARLVIVASTPEQLAQRQAHAAMMLAGAPLASPVLGAGCYFQERPIEGELAFVFAASAGAYAGMGRRLALALPELARPIEARFSRLREAVGWIYDPEAPAPGLMAKLWGTAWLAQIHAGFSRDVLGLAPQAVIGLSAGETNALLAMGAWPDVEGLYDDLHASEVFTRHLGGACEALPAAWGPNARWANWRVVADQDVVEAAIAAEPTVRITIIHAPGDYTIGGEAEACARVARKLGLDRAQHLGYDVAVHCPELDPYADRWRKLHDRETVPVPGIRFYAHAVGGSYELTRPAVAEALTEHVRRPIDFRTIIERAYADGVRIFVEHGPQGGCTAWIRRILGDRPHLAVALDQAGEPSLDHQANAAAQLAAAGVPLRTLAPFTPAPAWTPGPAQVFPAHQAPVRFPAWPDRPAARESTQKMAPAPALPPVMAAAVPAAPLVAPAPLAVAHVASASPQVQAYVDQLEAQKTAQQSYLLQAARAQAQFVALSARAFARAAGLPAAAAAVPARSRAHQAGAPTPAMLAPATTLPTVPPPAPALTLPTVPPAPAVPSPVIPAPAPALVPPPGAPAAPRGPSFSRQDLEVLASGRIADIWGPAFANQANYARQVRMPEPPLLLANRVTGIDAPQGQLGVGTIWTETDVQEQAWYMHHGRMPAGLMIESGQADLLLVSWMGIDALNRGDRVYRLLGCELTYHAGPDGVLPQPGDTLAYDIHVDGHASQGPIRLFFFHYDCRVNGDRRLSVREGQAGFFTDEELAGSGGVLWDAAEADPCPNPRLAPPRQAPSRSALDAAALCALAAGDGAACFGPGFERLATHQRTPAPAGGKMLLLDEVTHLDPTGGPWGRGYLRATTRITPDAWFFDGHFKNDPCMPGTLMFEGCLQAMAVYLAGLGFTIDHDGWRFEPVPDEPYKLSCRGQVIPSSRELVYEVFVEEVLEGDMPTLYADLLCTVDGLKAFHCRRMGLRLAPDWPLTSRPGLVPEPTARDREAAFNWEAMLACAWGRPSDAFGPRFAPFDGVRRLPRLPGPPYHFMSRIMTIEPPAAGAHVGTRILAEYDIPPDAWYFTANGQPTMPYAVLLEAALQPCGWLASYIGTPLETDQRLFFRNLDGTASLHQAIGPDAGTLATHVTLTNLSRSAGMVILSFDVTCYVGETKVYDMKTVFGFFPAAALAEQKGLPTTDEARAFLTAPSTRAWELDPARGELPRLPAAQLLVLDRITGWWPEGGAKGLGKLRAEMTVDPAAWFFKAHFFQDPVQPGSLGLEAMLQGLQVFMQERGMGAGMPNPVFEAIDLGRPMTWKYRGQVLPHNRTVTTELDILEVGPDYVVAEGSLWVDGMRIYNATNVGMRVRPAASRSLHPTRDPWLGDHRPTYTTPALPMMVVADLLASAASRPVVALEDVKVNRWILLPDQETQFRTVVLSSGNDTAEVALEAWREAPNPAMSRFEQVTTGRVRMADSFAPAPAPLPPLADAADAPDPYAAGRLFHGPAFQVLQSLKMGPAGSSAVLTATPGPVPVGLLHPVLLDGITHAIPNDDLGAWGLPADRIAYPARIVELQLYGPPPRSGAVRCEVRLAGPEPCIEAQLIAGDAVWATLKLEMVTFPKGPIGSAPAASRQAFLRDRLACPDVNLTTQDGDTTRLALSDLAASDWLPGTVAAIYNAGPLTGLELARAVAIKEHVARRTGVHPSSVDVAACKVQVETLADVVVVKNLA